MNSSRRFASSSSSVCVVQNCQTKRTCTAFKTFEFPSDLRRRHQWISAIVEATLIAEEETLPLEDLLQLENKRIQMEMDLANTLGDHSFVCAKHFQPEDVVVRNNTGRLSTTAVPSVFKNYPLQMPCHFFKNIYQTVNDIIVLGDEEGQNEGIYVADGTDPLQVDEMKRLPMPNTRHVSDPLSATHQTTPSRNYTKSKSVILADGYKKKLQIAEAKCRQLETKLAILEKKQSLYNIDVLEKDAQNKNEEALFLLNMLKSYTVFENTRKEILTPEKDETIIKLDN